LISVSVPGTAQAGTATNCAIVWDRGDDVYQVSSERGYLAALELADSMRPWPAG
jgi:hypothetical protein